jgi:hypothetical protein
MKKLVIDHLKMTRYFFTTPPSWRRTPRWIRVCLTTAREPALSSRCERFVSAMVAPVKQIVVVQPAACVMTGLCLAAAAAAAARDFPSHRSPVDALCPRVLRSWSRVCS